MSYAEAHAEASRVLAGALSSLQLAGRAMRHAMRRWWARTDVALCVRSVAQGLRLAGRRRAMTSWMAHASEAARRRAAALGLRLAGQRVALMTALRTWVGVAEAAAEARLHLEAVELHWLPLKVLVSARGRALRAALGAWSDNRLRTFRAARAVGVRLERRWIVGAWKSWQALFRVRRREATSARHAATLLHARAWRQWRAFDLRQLQQQDQLSCACNRIQAFLRLVKGGCAMVAWKAFTAARHVEQLDSSRAYWRSGIRQKAIAFRAWRSCAEAGVLVGIVVGIITDITMGLVMGTIVGTIIA
jgi:hypothetical protein